MKLGRAEEVAAGRPALSVEPLKCEVTGCPNEPQRFWERDLCGGHGWECMDEVDQAVRPPQSEWPPTSASEAALRVYAKALMAAVDGWIAQRVRKERAK